eukprot:1734353-Alexandrium_andersonii.AAC.1
MPEACPPRRPAASTRSPIGPSPTPAPFTPTAVRPQPDGRAREVPRAELEWVRWSVDNGAQRE